MFIHMPGMSSDMATKLFFIILLNLTLSNCLAQFPNGSRPSSGEKQLIADLFKDYDPDARPVIDITQKVTVSLMLKIKKLEELSTKYQYISVLGWIDVSWTDEQLKWNKSDYNGLDSVNVSPTKVWLPTFILANTASNTFYNEIWYERFKAHIANDGIVSWYPGGIFKSACRIDVYLFPFDDQICHFRFENWAYDGDKVNLTFHPSAHEELLKYYIGEDGQWDIISLKVLRHDLMYKSALPQVNFGLHLKRKSLFYVTNIVLLSLLLAVLVALIFKLPVESGERISMGITLLLAFSVFILMINDTIPETSLNVPLIIIYLISFMTLTTFGICESVLILYFYHHSGITKPPKWIKKLLSISCKNISGLRKPVVHVFNDFKKNDQEPESQENIEENVKEWQDLARSVDKLCFWLVVLAFTLVIFVLLVVLPYATPSMDIEIASQKWHLKS